MFQQLKRALDPTDLMRGRTPPDGLPHPLRQRYAHPIVGDWYQFYAARVPGPGAGNKVFESPLQFAPVQVQGMGTFHRQFWNPFGGSTGQSRVLPTSTVAGLGGLQAGCFALQGLIDTGEGGE